LIVTRRQGVSLRLNSSDGDITIHNAVGTLEARASDGHMQIDGPFSSVQLHTSDGNLDFALAHGTQLSAASRIESSDGRVTIRVPQDLKADLDVSTSDGHVDCALPLTMDHYDNGSSSGQPMSTCRRFPRACRRRSTPSTVS
jgi:DUF4097 and DUF4098 domain-containing protein YvlB